MKIAIIGAGVSGLSCAIECERLGVVPEIFEQDCSAGWIWPSVSFWPSAMMRKMGDIRRNLKVEYGIDFVPLADCNSIVLKSPNKVVHVEGKCGYFIRRGKDAGSIENQLFRQLKKTAIHFNNYADYDKLSREYDYVVIATGLETEARKLGVWTDVGLVRTIGGVAVGNFRYDSSTLYLNTGYAGTGYARITPFNSNEAIVGLYDIGHSEYELERLFSRFLEIENLTHLKFLFKLIVNPFSTGYVNKVQIGNILLAGRAAGLIERLMGVGAPESIMSGVLAAQAMIQGKDYGQLLKPLQKHTEDISVFREPLNTFKNKDFDRLLEVIDTPVLKKIIYGTHMSIIESIGAAINKIK